MREKPSPSVPSTLDPAAACAVSGHLDTRTAGTEVAYELHDEIGTSCDLALVFASYHHAAALPEAVDTIRQTIGPRTILAVTAEAVLGGGEEVERGAGMSALAMRLPEARFSTWTSTPSDPMRLSNPDAIADRIGLADDFRVAIMFADPFSTPITRLLPAVTSCGGAGRRVPVVGGLASGASQPGHNRLILNGKVLKQGAVGVSIAGRVGVDFVVSQGCRPIATPFVVTKAKVNVILELGGHPALEVVREVASSLNDHEKELLSKGLLIGEVIDEQKRPLGRGDFLVRSILGLEKGKGDKEAGIVVGDVPRAGQTIQFHVRDAVTATEDLQLLLDAQVMKAPPFAGLLFTCNGRGQRLFGTPNHDTSIINERVGPLPMAGFFAAGELGPVGERSFLHGHTAALALFR